ncbi:MAG: hypothetical protein AAFQ82_22775 [Myxococcota bacterium]
MRAVVFIALATGAIGLGACAGTSSFVLTGKTRAALGEKAPVQPYLTGVPETAYEEIGVVEVRGHSLAVRVARAQEVARAKGGNGVILMNTTTQVHAQSIGGVGGAVVGPGIGAPGWFALSRSSTTVHSYDVDRYVVVHVP